MFGSTDIAMKQIKLEKEICEHEEKKETKEKQETCEHEEKKGTGLPSMLPIGEGQLEKALPATRLLEKRRLMHLVHEELQQKKVEFAKKEEILQKREDALRDKDLAMQESENAIKKKRAEKKSNDENRMRLEKEQEIIQLEDSLQKLNEKRNVTLAHLEKLVVYQKYLESVLEKAPQFRENNDIMLRYATLVSSHEELKKHVAQCEAEIDIIRTEIQSYLKNSANTILTLNNDINVTRKELEKKKQETNELQQNIDSMLQMAATRTLARNQICMAAENLFFRIDKASFIARPVQDNPLKNLDMVADFIADLSYIQKAYKGFLAKTIPK